MFVVAHKMRATLLLVVFVAAAFSAPTSSIPSDEDGLLSNGTVANLFANDVTTTTDLKPIPTKNPQKFKAKITKSQFVKKPKEKGYTKYADVVITTTTTTVTLPTLPPTTIQPTTEERYPAARTSLVDNVATTEAEIAEPNAISTESVHNGNINFVTEIPNIIQSTAHTLTLDVDSTKRSNVVGFQTGSTENDNIATTTIFPFANEQDEQVVSKDAKQNVSILIPSLMLEALISSTPSTTLKVSIKPVREEEEDRIITLIDLERNNSKSINVQKATTEEGRNGAQRPPTMTTAQSTLLDMGHDGVKLIKKKQLIESHFQKGTTREPLATRPTQQTGFLGPIFMKEKVFRVNTHDGFGFAVLEETHEPKDATAIADATPTSPKESRQYGVTEHKQVTSASTLEGMKEFQFTNQRTQLAANNTLDDIEHNHTTPFSIVANEAPRIGPTEPTMPPTLLNSENPEFEVSMTRDSNIPLILSTSTFTTTTEITKGPTTSILPQVESKISDFRFEVIESTPETFVLDISSREPTLIGPTEFVTGRPKIEGKPEPAAIEIHINVSEGFGTEGEDLEFSYRQSGVDLNSKKSELITLRPGNIQQNESSHETEEILIVEIIDGNGTDTKVSGETKSDDIFVPDLKLEPIENYSPIAKDPKEPRDRDSDTIFYISNTEVKVGESTPTQNSHPKAGHPQEGAKFESQFFPTIYEEDVRIDYHKKTNNSEGVLPPERYEEDIILSPLKGHYDPLKIIESPQETESKTNPLDVSYVAESYIEIEESPGLTTTVHPTPPQPTRWHQASGNNHDDASGEGNSKDTKSGSDIVGTDPEMAISVPVIAALPPQIELKEIDFMPETSIMAEGSTTYNESPSKNNYDEEKMMESSIQYGGDLIEDSVDLSSSGGNFDIDTGYPFGDSMKRTNEFGRANEVLVTSEILMHHHPVSHLRKDELIADIVGGSESLSTEVLEGEALTMNEVFIRKGNDTINSTVTEKMGNATAYSVLEETSPDGELNFTDFQTLFLACAATIIPLIFSVMLAFGVRYLWRKLRSDPDIEGGLVADSSSDPLASKSAPIAQDELKSSESGYIFNRSCDTLESSTEIPAKSNCNGGGVVDVGHKDNESAGVSDNNEQSGQSPTEGGNGGGGCSGSNGTTAVFVSNNNAFLAPASSTATFASASASASTTHPYSRSGSNGSIITMTLKNNHLIVETEERNDISRDARETKMHYNNAEKDGVFVVEVSRGADSKMMPDESPSMDTSAIDNGACNARSHEEVQIHPPPIDESADGVLHQIDEADEPNESSPRSDHEPTNLGNSNTGLSQSDLSSSSDDSNKRYAYGNQELYTVDVDDYSPVKPPPQSYGTTTTPPKSPDDERKFQNGDCLHSPSMSSKSDQGVQDDRNGDRNHCNGTTNGGKAADSGHDTENKPIITAALLKQDTIIEEGNDIAIRIVDCSTGQDTNDGNDNDDVIRFNGHKLNSTEGTEEDTLNGHINGRDVELNDCCTENGFDSIMSLPDPPSTEEIKQFNDGLIMDSNQLDSLPPPPPPNESPSADMANALTPNHRVERTDEKTQLPTEVCVPDEIRPQPTTKTTSLVTSITAMNENHSNGLVEVGSS